MEDAYIHPSAQVETSNVGRGTYIWAYTHVMDRVAIGENCRIGEHCFVESGVVIGSNVTIKNGNMLWEGVVLEDGVFVGPQVSFTNDSYPRSPRLPEAASRYEGKDWLKPTVVRYGASLGAGSIVLAGVTINEYAMVGAGAVVTKDIAAHALVVGNPARFVRWVCRCGQPLGLENSRAGCAVCNTMYTVTPESIQPDHELDG